MHDVGDFEQSITTLFLPFLLNQWPFYTHSLKTTLTQIQCMIWVIFMDFRKCEIIYFPCCNRGFSGFTCRACCIRQNGCKNQPSAFMLSFMSPNWSKSAHGIFLVGVSTCYPLLNYIVLTLQLFLWKPHSFPTLISFLPLLSTLIIHSYPVINRGWTCSKWYKLEHAFENERRHC